MNPLPHRNTKKNSITLYDIGPAILSSFFLFLIMPVISFIWNAAWLTIILKLLKRLEVFKSRNKWVVFLFITIVGGIIDYFTYLAPVYAYIQTSYNNYFESLIRTNKVTYMDIASIYNTFKTNVILAHMFAPILVLGLFYFLLSRFYLKLQVNEAIVVGVAMGFLTAPWIAVILNPLYF